MVNFPFDSPSPPILLSAAPLGASGEQADVVVVFTGRDAANWTLSGLAATTGDFEEAARLLMPGCGRHFYLQNGCALTIPDLQTAGNRCERRHTTVDAIRARSRPC